MMMVVVVVVAGREGIYLVRCDGNFESGTEEGFELAVLMMMMMMKTMSRAGVGT